MKDFSVSMALVDYIPVMLFAAAVLLLMRDLYEHMRKDAFALFAAGSMRNLPPAKRYSIPTTTALFGRKAVLR